MTYEEQVALAKTCKTAEEFTQKSAYCRGREEARADIEAGQPNITELHPYVAELFGAAWVKGYTDYFRAWEVLNGGIRL